MISRARRGLMSDRYAVTLRGNASHQSNALSEKARGRHHFEEAATGCPAAPGLRLCLSCTQQDHGWTGTQRHSQLAEERARVDFILRCYSAAILQLCHVERHYQHVHHWRPGYQLDNLRVLQLHQRSRDCTLGSSQQLRL
jgi:hypothetical protein